MSCYIFREKLVVGFFEFCNENKLKLKQYIYIFISLIKKLSSIVLFDKILNLFI